MKWRWLIFAAFVLFVLWLICSINKPTQPKFHEIRWQAPTPINWIFQCDLDGDKSDEVLTESGGKWWWLRPSLEGWKATQLPVKDAAPNAIYAIYKPLHFGTLAWDENNSLCFVCYRNGWRQQKLLDAPVLDFIWLDVDSDGRVNDVLVLKRKNLWWFRISDNGRVIVQDKRKAPPQVSLFWLASWSKQGKLVVSSKWQRAKVHDLDWDGDGIPEVVHFRPINWGRDELMVHFSSTKTQKRFVLPKLTSPICMNVADIDGDGQKELTAIASHRIIVVNRQGKRHFTPCNVVSATTTPKPIPKLWVTRLGQKDWLWAASTKIIWLLRHDGKGYQVRQWKFEGYPLAIWKDKEGTWFAFWSEHLLTANSVGRWIVNASNWLRSLGIPIRILRKKVWLHLWKWGVRRDDWQQVKRVRIPTRLDYSNLPFDVESRPLDLDRDGRNELVVKINALVSAMIGETWLFVGQWYLISEYLPGFILRDKHRMWIVGIDGKDRKVLRGVTLTSVR